jgi:hypothetical protein
MSEASIPTTTPENESSMFQTKYDEFASELIDTFPELEKDIRSALALSPEIRLSRFQSEIHMMGTSDTTANPGTILPGVTIPDSIWATLSDSNKGAIWEYVKMLTMCCFLEAGFAPGTDASKQPWMEDVMNKWKESLGNVDFEGIMGKFAKIFGVGATDASGNAAAGAGTGGFKMPELPQKFLKGNLAKLAEEIVRDIKPEDLGLTKEMIDECEKSPSRAINILVQVFTKNPSLIQDTIKRIGKRLQQKVQSGAIRPQEIAKEAEELMKEFSSNPEFVGVMESLKSMFGFEDMDLARQAGREGSARLSAVQQRLRKKLEAKKAKNAGAK